MTSPIEPLPSLGAYVPDEADRATRDLATAVLLDDESGMEASLARIERIDAERRAAGEAATGLVPFALDARNATLDDEILYRRQTRALLERNDLAKPLRARLEAESQDDPLRLASRRLADARQRRIGRMVNAVIEPAGRSLASTALLPYRLLQGILNAALVQHQEDALTPPERQALDHWKRFIERHPESPEAASLLLRVDDAQQRWLRTQRDRTLRRARDALEGRDALLAAALAERALDYAPEDPEALELLADAEARARHWNRERQRSLTTEGGPAPIDPAQRPLLLALLAPNGPIEERADELLEEDPEGPLSDEAAFSLAIAAGERGLETEMWQRFDAIARKEDEASNMARHARALTTSPVQNPYRAFREARGEVTSKKLRWLAFGPLLDGARDRDLPRPVEWMVEVPSFVGVAAGLPNRLIRYPFLRAEWDVPSVLARRYLELYPEGEHAAEMREWLRDYEADRGNHVGALKLAEGDPGFDPEDLAPLRRKAARQALEASLKEERRDVRYELLREVAREFQGTPAGREAGEFARRELEEATPQHIRVSRGFLKENPSVAGPEGLALRPQLLDEDTTNGELHPDGVTLLGGRWLEFSFVNASGRESQPPERRRQEISHERLARLVAQLEETSLRMALVDSDVPVEHDADRDLFFERARLGALTPDGRPHAESTFEFRGVRERYGLVRSRESILPVEIVLQGSFDDFGLGAFPRIRMPRPTPDAFLYR